MESYYDDNKIQELDQDKNTGAVAKDVRAVRELEQAAAAERREKTLALRHANFKPNSL